MMPTPLPAPGQPPRRRRVLYVLAGIAGMVVIGLLAGLTTTLIVDRNESSGPKFAVSELPFQGAIAALAAAPEVRYQTTVADVGDVDVRVTSGGSLLGTITDAGEVGQLLRVGGVLYVKLPASALPAGANAVETSTMKDKWLTGHQVNDLLGSLPARFIPPQQLSSVLAAGLGATQSFAAPPIGGVPVRAANTRFGIVYVAANQPYRVVRVVPPASPLTTTPPTGLAPGSSSPQPASPTGSVRGASYWIGAPRGPTAAFENAVDNGLSPSGLDFPAEQPTDAATTYKNLEAGTRQLSTAIDSDLSFNLKGNGTLQCGDTGCKVSVTVTSSVAAGSTSSTITGGTVNASLTATVVIGGQAAGGCASTGPLPLNGTGTISCSDPGAAGVYASVAAAKKAAAQAQSEAEGGIPVQYYIDWNGEYYVYATAQVDVAKLVQDEGDEATENNVSIYKAPAKGLTQKLLDKGFQAEDFPGDPTANGYPDGHAYFGFQDKGKAIALDYATRSGGYDPNVVEVTIPAADFAQYFQRYVQSYDGVPNAEVVIPNTDFGRLNGYPRKLVK